MAIQTIPAAGGGVTQKVQEFTSTGSFVVPSNCTSVEVFLVGGGGGAGGVLSTTTQYAYTGGGGGGGVIRKTITVTAGSTYTVTIGAGGAGGTSNTVAGSVGSDTTFGSLATAYGGGGGHSWNDANGTVTIGTSRATSGSTGGGQAQLGDGVSAGGGAGGNAQVGVNSNASTISLIGGASSNNSTLQGGAGCPSVAGAQFCISGIGIEGYGGGGVGGTILTYTTSGSRIMALSGGAPGRVSNQVTETLTGISASANTGGGGGGGYIRAASGSTVAGGAGGSGYARITYWS